MTKPLVFVAVVVVFLSLGWFYCQELVRALFVSKSAVAVSEPVVPPVPGNPIGPAPVPPRVPVPGEGFALPHLPGDQALPLPLLTPRSLAERAPVDDVTAEASASAALAGSPPPRTRPVPFQRQTIPDPYGDRRPERVEETLTEIGLPAVRLPPAPGR